MSFVVRVDDSALELPIAKLFLEKVVGVILKKLRTHGRMKYVSLYLGQSPSELGLKLCLDAEMRVLNHHFRGLDRSTDVLSFPTIELEEEEARMNEGYLGDLVLSLPALVRGAKKMRHSIEEEFVEVFIHGVLHLLGFDHVKNKRDADEMFQLQGELFSLVKSDIKSSHGKRKSLRRSPSSKPPRTRRKIKRTKRTS